MTTTELTSLLVGLKFKLIQGATGSTRVLLGAAALLTTLVVVIGSLTIAATSLSEHRATYLVVGLTSVALLWLVVPIIFGGGEGTLDPSRFTLFPITSGQLVVALLAAAFVGLPGLGTAVVAFSTLFHASGPFSAFVLGFAAAIFTLTAVLSGRVGMALMSGLLRGRRFRELAGGIAAIIGVTVGLAGPLLSEFTNVVTIARLENARRLARVLPWGWAAESMGRASDGDELGALVFLAWAVAFVCGLWTLWRHLLDRQLTTRVVSSSRAASTASLVPRWMQPFGDSPIVAVWARSLRQLRRDPREFLEIAGFLPMMLIFALPGLDALRSGDDRAVLGSASMGLALGITSLNMFGADGRSFGVDALAAPNMRAVLVGKSLARMTIGVPLIFSMSLVLAKITGGWQFVLPSVAIGFTGLLAMVGVGMVVSTHYPFPLPESMTIGQGVEGCATGILRMMALVLAMAVAAPGVAATTYVSVFVSAGLGTLVGMCSLVYGLLVFLWSAQHSGAWASSKIPEIFHALSARS